MTIFGSFYSFMYPPYLLVEGSNHKVVKKQPKEGPRNFPESSHQNGSFGASQHIVTCCSHGAPAESPLTDTPCFGNLSQTWKSPSLEIVIGCFLLRLSGIKRFQVLSMRKCGPTKLNFGSRDFWAPS